MMHEVDQQELEILKHFYMKLKGTLAEHGNALEKDSLFLTLIKMSLNKTSKMFAESTISRFGFDTENINSLILKKHIRVFDEFEKTNEYLITAFGIWKIESIENGWNIETLLQYFQENKFTFKVQNKPLKDVERIPLLAMMVMRTFSEIVPMNINDKTTSDAWVSIFDQCAAFLKDMKVVKKATWNTSRRGNEHPISYIMRRSNDLPQKTRHVYNNLGDNKYFLKVDCIERDKNLLTLIKLVFGKIDSFGQKNKIYTFMTDLAYDKSKNIGGNNQYITPDWDQILENVLNECFIAL